MEQTAVQKERALARGLGSTGRDTRALSGVWEARPHLRSALEHKAVQLWHGGHHLATPGVAASVKRQRAKGSPWTAARQEVGGHACACMRVKSCWRAHTWQGAAHAHTKAQQA